MVSMRVFLVVSAIAAGGAQVATAGVMFTNPSRELDPPTGISTISSLAGGDFNQSINVTNFALDVTDSVTLNLSQHSTIGPGSVQYTSTADMTLDSTGNQTQSAQSSLLTMVVLDEPMTVSSTLAAMTDGDGWSSDATLSNMSTSHPLIGVPDFVLPAGTYTLSISNGVFLNGFLPSGSASLGGIVSFTSLPAPASSLLAVGSGLLFVRRRRS